MTREVVRPGTLVSLFLKIGETVLKHETREYTDYCSLLIELRHIQENKKGERQGLPVS